MKRIVKIILGIAAAFVFCFAPVGCSEEINPEGTGFSEVKNPVQDSDISHYGETVTVSFIAEAEWDAEVVTSDGGDWARIVRKRGDDAPGKGSVRVEIDRNKAEASRALDIYVTVSGFNRSLLCSMTQQSSLGAAIDLSLDSQMHAILAEQYLWNEKYNELDAAGQIEKTLPYSEFLDVNLKKLGDVNLEDGGLYREYSSLSGQRYIYSYIQEITGGGSAASATKSPATRALTPTYGLGMGLTIASAYQASNNATRCFLLGFVYPDSPAAKAGLQRGDIITGVNGEPLTQENYQEYQQALYYSQVGTYTIDFERFREDGLTTVQKSATVTAAGYDLNPVLFAGIIQSEDKSVNVGYMVLESFDINAFEVIDYYLKDFQSNGIKDLILDLRFNPGGSVALCRYMLSSIAGRSHDDDVFAQLKFNDGRIETQTFGHGDNNADGLGQGPDLGLNRLYVICSENTGSSSEIIIKALEGIDFPVTTYGSKTEGKNVGMVVSRLTYGGRNFEFAPITYYYMNAKGDTDFASGIEVDKVLNDQDAVYSPEDDISMSFPYETADWGNYAGDSALLWAFMNATEGKDPEFSTGPGAKTKSGVTVRQLAPISTVQAKPQIGRFGSVIYPAE